MNLMEIIKPANPAHAGMTVADVLSECVARDVPGLPFCGGHGHIEGRISVRHIFRETCVPHDVVYGAHLLGDDIAHLNMEEIGIREVLARPVEPYVLEDVATLTMHSPLVKAMAIMEKFNSSYLFVLDDEERYNGVVTRLGIARQMLRHRDDEP